MTDNENRKEPKRKFAIWVKISTLDMVKKYYLEDNCVSQSEFMYFDNLVLLK